MAQLRAPSGNLGRTDKKAAPAGNGRLILTAEKERVMTKTHSIQAPPTRAICQAGDE